MNNVIRITIRISHPWPGMLLLICFLVSLTLSASVIAPNMRSSQQMIQATTFVPPAGRNFYVTYTTYTPTTAQSACLPGYHMASLWEILDVSELTYDFDYQSFPSKTVPDSGFGPPSNWYGWVRTGNDASATARRGPATARIGPAIPLAITAAWCPFRILWQTAPGDISSWDATTHDLQFQPSQSGVWEILARPTSR